MKFAPKEALVVVIAAVLAITAVVALVAESTRWLLALNDALLLVLVALVLALLRRHKSSQASSLERMERKIDNLALRVVTESQATHRELGGLIEELGSSLRDPDLDDSL